MRLKDKAAKEYRLQVVVRLRSEGHTQSQIARMTALCQSRVSDILKSYDENGESGLVIRSAPGARSKLDAAQLEQFKALLQAEAKASGFPTDGWTLKRAAQLVRDNFGITYSLEHIRRILKKTGFTRQRPQTKDYRRNEQAVQQWKSQTLPALKKSKEGGL